MTERKLKTVKPRLEVLVAQDRDLLKALVKEALDQILQAEMTESSSGKLSLLRRVNGAIAASNQQQIMIGIVDHALDVPQRFFV